MNSPDDMWLSIERLLAWFVSNERVEMFEDDILLFQQDPIIVYNALIVIGHKLKQKIGS